MDDSKKKRVLIFVEWFTPAYKAGGPVQSVANIIRVLHDEFDFKVVTSDRDLGDTESFRSVPDNVWIETPTHSIIHLSPLFRTRFNIEKIIKESGADIIYFNSLFSFRFTLLPLYLSRNVVQRRILAPRGMLGEGALQFKFWKKKAFIFAAKATGFFSNVVWHATGQTESDEIKTHFGINTKIFVASNISPIPAQEPAKRLKEQGKLRLLYISAITMKKNFLFALELLRREVDNHIELYVVGPIEHHRYWEECKKMIGRLPSNITVCYLGSIPNQDLQPVVSKCHFLLLPTWHENFCHVIVESLANGCPVIISDRTLWRHLESKHIGWDLPLEKVQEWQDIIERCCLMQQDEFDSMSRNAYVYARSFLSDPEMIHATRKLFLQTES